MPLDGHTFIVDCTKIDEYKHAPTACAHFLAEGISPGDEMMVRDVCLGTVTRTESEGPIARIYVELDQRIEHGTYQGG